MSKVVIMRRDSSEINGRGEKSSEVRSLPGGNRKEGLVIRRGAHLTREEGFKAGSRNTVRLLLIVLMMGLMASISVDPAASQVSIAVTPTRIPLSLAHDETQSIEVTLINQGTEEVDLEPRVMTYAEGASGEPVLGQDSTCSWFSPDRQALHLLPSQSGPFVFSATVPSGVEHGLYRFALTFDLVRSGGEGIGMTGGLAVIVELSVVPAENGGGSGFPLALTIVLSTLAVLLLGLVAAFAARRYGGGDKAGPVVEAGGEEQ